MLTEQEAKDTILHLRANKYTIAGIQAVTGLTITKICEVIYEQNAEDIDNDDGNYDGIF